MSRYRLHPTPAQEAVQRDHCAHARFTWNLAVEWDRHWHLGRASAPGYLEQCRQLTAAAAEHPWLAAGSQMVQQQARRDFAQAMTTFFDRAKPGGAAVVAQGRPGRGVPGRRGQARRGPPPVPSRRRGTRAEGRLGAVPLVPRGAAGGEVLPGDHGPGPRTESADVPGRRLVTTGTEVKEINVCQVAAICFSCSAQNRNCVGD
jgi:hypothetical protein